jgi:hypothetical protein
MKITWQSRCRSKGFILLLFCAASCAPSGEKKNNQMDKKVTYEKGSYGYDVTFFSQHDISTIELRDSSSNARVLIVPAYQGRVMTSTTNGPAGISFGWINYDLIASGKVNEQFNPYGGEERLWLGPEGGPFSIYFEKGKEQSFSNWKVPKEIDTVTFEVVATTSRSASFKKDFNLTNYSGTALHIGIERTVTLLTRKETENALGLPLDTSLSCVAYESGNTLTNKGKIDWSRQHGFLSVWLLSMFNPSAKGVVFIPFKKGGEKELGPVVSDDYFGKVPADRLTVKDGMIFFKTDGKYRSKIGIPPPRALPLCGSYDPVRNVLTILWCSLPETVSEYVNSKWGKQDDPLKGDVINSYNDGPNDAGTVMGPFFEIESSSPAAMLPSGGRITHSQRIFHIRGEEEKLDTITISLFGLSLKEIKQAFH